MRKYKIGDKVLIRNNDFTEVVVVTIVRLNGRGYNVQQLVSDECAETYITAKEIIRKLTPLEELL